MLVDENGRRRLKNNEEFIAYIYKLINQMGGPGGAVLRPKRLNYIAMVLNTYPLFLTYELLLDIHKFGLLDFNKLTNPRIQLPPDKKEYLQLL